MLTVPIKYFISINSRLHIFIIAVSTVSQHTYLDTKISLHFKRRDEGHVLGRMLDAPVPGKRRRGRHKTGGKTRVKEIWTVWGLKEEEDALDRTKWENDIIQYHSGDPR